MRNTWWVTRPKRSLVSVPLCLTALANAADGQNWRGNKDEIEQTFESQLEITELKRAGDRRDRTGGGARTYRAWFKSLGLLFLREDGTLRLTNTGEALVRGEPPLKILTEQVIKYQFPSAFSYSGGSAVDPRFKIRPFVFILQLLRDPRIGGWLDEKHEVAKLVLTYGENNSQQCVDLVVEKILEHRAQGDSSLDPAFVKLYRSSRSKETDFSRLERNLGDIANTFANWLGYTQLITRTMGIWNVADGAQQEVDQIIEEYTSKPLIQDWENEEVFQRRYGLLPGQRKDTRNLNNTQTITPQLIKSRTIRLAFMSLVSTKIVTSITSSIIEEIAEITGYPFTEVEGVLAKEFPGTSIGLFMNNYAQMAFDSRKQARNFEIATAEIFSKVFGFKSSHIGSSGPFPDIVIYSNSAKFAAILDSKAYKDGYSIGVSHQNRMRDYIEQFGTYGDASYELAFFNYVVSDHKSTVEKQIESIYEVTGVPGSVISARNIIHLVQQHQHKPLSHAELRHLFSQNRVVSLLHFDFSDARPDLEIIHAVGNTITLERGA